MIPCLPEHRRKIIRMPSNIETKNPHQLLLERVIYSLLALANLFSDRKLIIKSAPLRQNSTVHPELCQGRTVYLPIDLGRSASGRFSLTPFIKGVPRSSSVIWQPVPTQLLKPFLPGSRQVLSTWRSFSGKFPALSDVTCLSR